MRGLGALERTVLELLWGASGPRTAVDLRDELEAAEQRGLALTTVLTVLGRLEHKRFVVRDRGVRPHRYTATHTREEYVAELMHAALGESADRTEALARFVGTAGPAETEALRRLLGPA